MTDARVRVDLPAAVPNMEIVVRMTEDVVVRAPDSDDARWLIVDIDRAIGLVTYRGIAKVRTTVATVSGRPSLVKRAWAALAGRAS